MAGFFAEIGSCSKFKVQKNFNNIINEEYSSNTFMLRRFTINKFIDDKCFFQNNDYILIIDGVILNKNLFTEQNIPLTWEQIIINLYEKNGDSFFNVFRGSFSGLLYDKKADKWIIFTDHIGSKFIYYSTFNNTLLVSQDISVLYDYLKQNDISYSLDINSAYMLLSYGFMLEENTLCDKIKKLLPGHYIVLKNKNIELFQYYKLSNKPNIDKTEHEFIEEMDTHFQEAIKLEFEKDREYGYKNLVGLSGGLDSRMTTCVANKIGYKKQINFTFSQSNYLDEIIPKKIAEDLNHEWIFKALDNGLFLEDVDEITKITGGNILFFGLAHQNSIYKYLNFENLGILHSGQLGDVVYGTFYKSNNSNAKYSLGDGAYSKKYLGKIKDFEFKLDYENQEIFNFYNRGFSGANNGLIVSQEYTETLSPFYNIDVLEFALSIPVKLRFKHKIYKKWVVTKYPQAANYIWEKTKNPISKNPISIANKEVFPNQILPLIMRKIGLSKQIDSKRHMNPIDYWLRTSKNLNIFFDTYYKEHIQKVTNPKLKLDLEELYTTGNGTEKVQVISLLSAIKLFFYD